jgi:hypothetical protein
MGGACCTYGRGQVHIGFFVRDLLFRGYIQCVQTVYTVCTDSIYSVYRQYIHCVHTVYTVCTDSIYSVYRQYIQCVQTIHTVCTDNIYSLYTQYIQCVQTISTVCTHSIYSVYTQYIQCVHTIYTVCTRINYRNVPVTNSNKYLHYGTSGAEYYVYKCLFVCCPGVTTHGGCIFYSPVAGFSFLDFEVSRLHTTTRHSR